MSVCSANLCADRGGQEVNHDVWLPQQCCKLQVKSRTQEYVSTPGVLVTRHMLHAW